MKNYRPSHIVKYVQMQRFRSLTLFTDRYNLCFGLKFEVKFT